MNHRLRPARQRETSGGRNERTEGGITPALRLLADRPKHSTERRSGDGHEHQKRARRTRSYPPPRTALPEPMRKVRVSGVQFVRVVRGDRRKPVRNQRTLGDMTMRKNTLLIAVAAAALAVGSGTAFAQGTAGRPKSDSPAVQSNPASKNAPAEKIQGQGARRRARPTGWRPPARARASAARRWARTTRTGQDQEEHHRPGAERAEVRPGERAP